MRLLERFQILSHLFCTGHRVQGKICTICLSLDVVRSYPVVLILGACVCVFAVQPVGAGVDVFEGRPKLSAWRDRVRQEIGPELFDEAHKGILGATEFIKTIDDSKLQAFKPRIQKMFF